MYFFFVSTDFIQQEGLQTLKQWGELPNNKPKSKKVVPK